MDLVEEGGFSSGATVLIQLEKMTGRLEMMNVKIR